MFDNAYAMDAGEAGALVAHAAETYFTTGIHIPIFLWGDPGVGKTESVRSAALSTGAILNTQHLADREPTEIGGIMWEKDGRMIRLPPEDFPMKDDVRVIQFYDEVPQAPLMNKNILARIALEGMVGGHRMGNKVYVVMAGNYLHNRAGTSAMPAHLNARATHVHVIPNLDRWYDHATTHGVHPFVTQFNRSAPDDHHKPDPTKEASPNPRSWFRVSDIEKAGFAKQQRNSLIIGSVGAEAGKRYLAQAELYANMPDPDDVIANPRKAPIPDNRTTLHALMLALATKAKGTTIGPIIDYTSRLVGDEEYQALCLREARLRNPSITAAREYTKFAMSTKGQIIA